MHNGTPKWRLTSIVLLLSACSLLAPAQNAALFTSVKGIVNIKKSSGQIIRASAKDGLAAGDEVSTSNGASAALMYYTGKEVTLSANKTYVVAKEAKEDSFLNRLASVFSNFLWSKEKSKSVLGASRGFEPNVNQSVNGIYPSYAVERVTSRPAHDVTRYVLDNLSSRRNKQAKFVIVRRRRRRDVQRVLSVLQ